MVKAFRDFPSAFIIIQWKAAPRFDPCTRQVAIPKTLRVWWVKRCCLDDFDRGRSYSSRFRKQLNKPAQWSRHSEHESPLGS